MAEDACLNHISDAFKGRLLRWRMMIPSYTWLARQMERGNSHLVPAVLVNVVPEHNRCRYLLISMMALFNTLQLRKYRGNTW
jgi:hypothetical protein